MPKGYQGHHSITVNGVTWGVSYDTNVPGACEAALAILRAQVERDRHVWPEAPDVRG